MKANPPPSLPHQSPSFRELLSVALREDGASLDWTSLGLRTAGKAPKKIRASLEPMFPPGNQPRAHEEPEPEADEPDLPQS